MDDSWSILPVGGHTWPHGTTRRDSKLKIVGALAATSLIAASGVDAKVFLTLVPHGPRLHPGTRSTYHELPSPRAKYWRR